MVGICDQDLVVCSTTAYSGLGASAVFRRKGMLVNGLGPRCAVQLLAMLWKNISSHGSIKAISKYTY